MKFRFNRHSYYGNSHNIIALRARRSKQYGKKPYCTECMSQAKYAMSANLTGYRILTFYLGQSKRNINCCHFMLVAEH